MPTMNDRLPVLLKMEDEDAQALLDARIEACAPSIAAGFGLPESWLTTAKHFGCGSFGCAYGLKTKTSAGYNVLKITGDNMEGHTIALLHTLGKKPPGIVRYGRIFQLGGCSVTPGLGPFVYRNYTTAQEVSYTGPGAPYRPLWVVEREELPNVLPVLKRRKLNRAQVEMYLATLVRWASDRATQLVPELKFGRPFHTDHDRTMAYLKFYEEDGSYTGLTKQMGAESLLEAIDWLFAHKIIFLDFGNSENLGWRKGTGLVIRDIGYSASAGEGRAAASLSSLHRWRLTDLTGLGVLSAPDLPRSLARGFF